jgi:signal transduction histidine kinase
MARLIFVDDNKTVDSILLEVELDPSLSKLDLSIQRMGTNDFLKSTQTAGFIFLAESCLQSLCLKASFKNYKILKSSFVTVIANRPDSINWDLIEKLDVNDIYSSDTVTSFDVFKIVKINRKPILDLTETPNKDLETLGKMAGGIAHDLNNKLAVIDGYVDNLSYLVNTPEVNLRVDRIKKAILSSSDLLKKLLAFGRKQRLNKSVNELTSLLGSSLEMVRTLVPENIQIRLNMPPQKVYALIDPVQFDQVIMNLVINASEAIGSKDYGYIGITMDEKKDPLNDGKKIVHVEVEDNGSGIEKENLKNVFVPYFTTKQYQKGTGLGLSVVDGIIDQHGGKISVDSQLGEGTSFLFSLPSVSADKIDSSHAVKIQDIISRASL